MMHIDKLIIKTCFKEVYKYHLGNNKYLEPQSWFRSYLKSVGINTDLPYWVITVRTVDITGMKTTCILY